MEIKGMKRSCVLALVVCVILGIAQTVQADAPGLKATVSQNALNYLVKVGVPIAEKDLSTMKIPDISDVAKTPIGKVDLDISNMAFVSLSLPSIALDIQPPSTLSFSGGMIGDIHFDWRYKKEHWPHTRDHGRGEVNLEGAFVSLSIKSFSNNGKLQMTVDRINVDTGKIKIKLHGGAGWFYDIFINLFKHKIEKSIKDSVEKQVTEYVNTNLDNHLATLPMKQSLGNTHTDIRLDLVADPTCNSTYMSVAFKGEVEDSDAPTEVPLSPLSLPDTLRGQFLEVVMDDYVFNTAGYTFWKKGLLAVEINNNNTKIPIDMNSKTFKLILPGLQKNFPDAPLSFEFSARTAPTLKTSKDSGMLVVLDAVANCTAITPAGPQSAFALDVAVVMQADVQVVNGTHIMPSLSLLKIDMKQISSNIGTFHLKLIDDLINLLLGKVVIPLANKKMPTIPIPVVKGVHVVDPAIIFSDSYIALSSSFQYSK